MLTSILAIVERDDLDWVIEEHDNEIRITCVDLLAARLPLVHGLLGPIRPEPEWAYPPERMEALRDDVVAVLADCARTESGPWATMGGAV